MIRLFDRFGQIPDVHPENLQEALREAKERAIKWSREITVKDGMRSYKIDEKGNIREIS